MGEALSSPFPGVAAPRRTKTAECAVSLACEQTNRARRAKSKETEKQGEEVEQYFRRINRSVAKRRVHQRRNYAAKPVQLLPERKILAVRGVAIITVYIFDAQVGFDDRSCLATKSKFYCCCCLRNTLIHTQPAFKCTWVWRGEICALLVARSQSKLSISSLPPANCCCIESSPPPLSASFVAKKQKEFT